MKKFFGDPTISSWVFLGAKISILLILTTLIVKSFSVGEIALWYLFASIQGFAHLFDVGFSATIIRFTAYSLAKKNEKKFADSFQQLYGSMNTVFSALTIFVFIFLFLTGIFSVNGVVSENEIVHGALSYKIIFIIMPINFFLKKNDAFIKGLNKVSLFNNWNAGMYLLTGASTITAILLDSPFYMVVLVNQLATLLNSVKNIFLLKSVTGFNIKMHHFSYNKSILEEYWRPTWKSALISFSSNGANNLINILIPKFFSIEVAASYLFSMRLIQFISEFSWAPFYSHLPEFIQKYKQSKIKETAKKAYGRLEISLLLFIGGALLLSLSADFVLSLIDAKTKFIPLGLVAPLLLMLTLERFTAMHSQVIMFSNNIEHYKHYVIMAFAYILLFFVFKDMIGLYAIPVAYIIAILIPFRAVLNRSLRLMETNLWVYFKERCTKVVLLFIFAAAIIYYVGS